jgi:hypothetical protein
VRHGIETGRHRQEIVDDATFSKNAGASGMDASCPMMHGK